MTPDLSIANLRREYTLRSLRRKDLLSDPIAQFSLWLQEAIAAELPEPNAMILATADDAGLPSARTVLLKQVDKRGFAFFTSYESDKSKDLQANPRAALVFNWIGLERQVIAKGAVEKLGREEAEVYFQSRPRKSQIGAWASNQSSVVEGREFLERKFAEVEARFGDGTIELPPFWGGFLVRPIAIEFWQGRPSRLHDRLRYRHENGAWIIERLSP